jgi:hypothetical protein
MVEVQLAEGDGANLITDIEPLGRGSHCHVSSCGWWSLFQRSRAASVAP